MNFDLNIQNYNKNEIEDIFDLPPNYNVSILDSKALSLKNSILTDTNITVKTRDQTINFISNARRMLEKGNNNVQNSSSNVENIYNLDKSLKPSSTIDAGNTEIIQKEITPYINSSPSNYFPGVFNPLKKRTLTKNLNIDTRFRDNYYATQSSNFLVDLPIKFSNILSMELSAFELPSTSYVISKQLGNNFMWLTASLADDENEAEKGSIIIPDGNYNPQDLIDYINNFIATDATFSSYTFLKNIIFALNIGGSSDNSGSGQTMVGIIDLYTGDPFNYSINFQYNKSGNPDYGTQLPFKLGWIMGFRQGAYKGSLNYVSESIVDTSGSKYLYLVIDDFNNSVNNGFYSAFNSSLLNKNILARLGVQSNPFNTLIQNKTDMVSTPRQYFGPVDIQKINIQLLDAYGRIVDLNNMDYSFCLTFECVYDI
jgi:hypothetical protein